VILAAHGGCRRLFRHLDFPSELEARPGARKLPLYRRVATILIIEDDPKTANAIRNGLRGEGHDAAVARTGAPDPLGAKQLEDIKPLTVDYEQFGARLKTLSSGFLKEWAGNR